MLQPIASNLPLIWSASEGPSPIEKAAPAPEPPPVWATLEEAVKPLVAAAYPGREVEVRGFEDEASGRYVVKVSDGRTGETLMQSPPDALLRFFASGRDALNPLVRIEA